eukprot:TRINITY_DN18893_c2_g1_i1.p1 TRINITY_DN18893_c2_g1~~TRINITY_DN18893_c2_g1_i1.p1  ORF type:complete len:615 (+),score=142.48 TRINITY_DN18893_c2_g1_i1:99-1943(+)
MVFKIPPEGLYTSLVDGNAEVVSGTLAEVVDEIWATIKFEGSEGVESERQLLKKTFRENILVRTATKCSKSHPLIDEAEQRLLDKHDALNQEKVQKWKKSAEQALLSIQPLLQELSVLEGELRSLQKNKAKKQPKIFSAAKRGVKKGIKRGTKLAAPSQPHAAVPSTVKVKTAPVVAPKAVRTTTSAKVAKVAPKPMVKTQKVAAGEKNIPSQSQSGNHLQAVTSAGLSAGLFGGVASLRRSLRNSENAKIETGKQTDSSVDDIIVPAIQDAAIAAGTAGGTAFAVAQVAENSTLVNVVTPGLATGMFTLLGVGSVVSSWSSGSMTQREFRKALTKISISTTITAMSVASLVTAPATGAAVGVGSVLVDIFGLTDHIGSLLFGKDLRTLRVELITSYAAVLNIEPQAANESIRTSFKQLHSLTSCYGSQEDVQVLEYCCAQLLLLRDDPTSTEGVPPTPVMLSKHEDSSLPAANVEEHSDDGVNNNNESQVTKGSEEPAAAPATASIDISQMRPIEKPGNRWGWFSKKSTSTPLCETNPPDPESECAAEAQHRKGSWNWMSLKSTTSVDDPPKTEPADTTHPSKSWSWVPAITLRNKSSQQPLEIGLDFVNGTK